MEYGWCYNHFLVYPQRQKYNISSKCLYLQYLLEYKIQRIKILAWPLHMFLFSFILKIVLANEFQLYFVICLTLQQSVSIIDGATLS